VAQNAAHYRSYAAFKIDSQKDLAMIRAFDSALARSRPVPADRSKRTWTAGWFARGEPGIIKTLTVFTPVAAQVEWLLGLGPIYLNTFPSNVLAIARYVANNPARKPQILAIHTAGEPLTEEIRRQCRNHLGCNCIDLLSSAECGLIASDCPKGGVLHAQSELCRIEVLGEDDRPSRRGEWGRLIVTPLYNFGTPLIRYDTGDLVRIAPPCTCGRHHLPIERGTGRPANLFQLPGKSWFRPELDSAIMERLLNGARWQLVQISASSFELKYMPSRSGETIDRRKLQRTLKDVLGGDHAITIKPVAALGLASSGKFQATVNQSKR
jgi:phenylacetate-CoA ligase